MNLQHLALPRDVQAGTAAYTVQPYGLVDINGQPVVFDGDDTVTVSVLNPAGSLIASPGVTASLVAASHRCNLTFNTSDAAKYPLGEGYVLRLTFTVDGVAHYRELTFDVVRYPYVPNVDGSIFPPSDEPPQEDPDFTRYITKGYADFYTFCRSIVRLSQSYAGGVSSSRLGENEYRSLATLIPADVALVPVEERIRPSLVLDRFVADRVVAAGAKVAFYTECQENSSSGFERKLEEAKSELLTAKQEFVATLRYDWRQTGRPASASDDGPTLAFRR